MLSHLEGVIKVSSFGGSSTELVVFFGGDVVVPIDSTTATIDDGESSLRSVVLHRDDYARRHTDSCNDYDAFRHEASSLKPMHIHLKPSLRIL